MELLNNFSSRFAAARSSSIFASRILTLPRSSLSLSLHCVRATRYFSWNLWRTDFVYVSICGEGMGGEGGEFV